MSRSRKEAREFTKFLTELNKDGFAKHEGTTYLAASYVMKILDEGDKLHTEENLKKLKSCKIVCSTDGQYLVIKRELIKLGLNPTDGKFVNLS